MQNFEATGSELPNEEVSEYNKSEIASMLTQHEEWRDALVCTMKQDEDAQREAAVTCAEREDQITTLKSEFQAHGKRPAHQRWKEY